MLSRSLTKKCLNFLAKRNKPRVLKLTPQKPFSFKIVITLWTFFKLKLSSRLNFEAQRWFSWTRQATYHLNLITQFTYKRLLEWVRNEVTCIFAASEEKSHSKKLLFSALRCEPMSKWKQVVRQQKKQKNSTHFKEFSLTKQKKTRPKKRLKNHSEKNQTKHLKQKSKSNYRLWTKNPNRESEFWFKHRYSLLWNWSEKNHSANPSFLLHFLFRRDKNLLSILISKIMKMYEQILKKQQ